jgi:Protein of unknown function (DUF3431)
MQVVIARYNEDISWAKAYDNVVVYNKGGAINDAIELPNVGREGHTFYHHIVENYDQLADYTAFLQGNPFDHYKNARTIVPKKFEMLADRKIKCSLNGCDHHKGLPLKQVYVDLFDVDEPMEFTFGAGGQFVVARDVVHKRPKCFYEKVRSLLEGEVNPIYGYVIERFAPLIMRV